MSKTIEAPAATEGKKGKKGLIIIILIAVIAIGAGGGGTWYFMKMSGDEDSEPVKPKENQPHLWILKSLQLIFSRKKVVNICRLD